METITLTSEQRAVMGFFKENDIFRPLKEVNVVVDIITDSDSLSDNIICIEIRDYLSLTRSLPRWTKNDKMGMDNLLKKIRQNE